MFFRCLELKLAVTKQKEEEVSKKRFIAKIFLEETENMNKCRNIVKKKKTPAFFSFPAVIQRCIKLLQ